jgi:Holliday junction resolvase RusA-like endonuclease
MIEFEVPGAPETWKRTTSFRGRRLTPKKVRDYEKAIALMFMAAKGRRCESGSIGVEIYAALPIPASWSRQKQRQAAVGDLRPWGGNSGDLDNYAKIVMDGLNGVAFHDDSQVVSLHAEKWYSVNPCLRVKLWEIGT